MDLKLQKVLMKQGATGIGLYWCIVEMLYEENGYLPIADIESIAFSVRVDVETTKSLIYDFGLFEHDENRFWSASALERIAMRKTISERRSLAGKKGNEKRWGKSQTDSNAIANVSQTYRNSSQEKKIKEKKSKEKEFTIQECIANNDIEKKNKRDFLFDENHEANMQQAYEWAISKNLPATKKDISAWYAYNQQVGWVTKAGTAIKDKKASLRCYLNAQKRKPVNVKQQEQAEAEKVRRQEQAKMQQEQAEREANAVVGTDYKELRKRLSIFGKN